MWPWVVGGEHKWRPLFTEFNNMHPKPKHLRWVDWLLNTILTEHKKNYWPRSLDKLPHNTLIKITYLLPAVKGSSWEALIRASSLPVNVGVFSMTIVYLQNSLCFKLSSSSYKQLTVPNPSHHPKLSLSQFNLNIWSV